MADSLLSAPNTWNTSFSLAGAGITIIGGLYGAFADSRISKAQQRIVKAQAQAQANQYAAQSVSYQVEAQRLAQSFGAQQYETIRQQQAYIEDAKVNMAASGATMEGSNTYMIEAQQEEFDRQNYYADLENTRQQASLMTESNQALYNAQLALEGGQIQASLMKSQNKYQMATSFLNMGTNLLGIGSNWYDKYSKINKTY